MGAEEGTPGIAREEETARGMDRDKGWDCERGLDCERGRDRERQGVNKKREEWSSRI